MFVQSYLFFDGRCEEALDFYKKALGAEVLALMRYKDSPEQPSGEGCGPDTVENLAEKVMHSAFKVGDTTIMAADGFAKGQPEFKGFGQALSVKDDAEAKKAFAALSDGGQVQQPLMETFFATSFGMVADRFGVLWMVLAPKPM